MMEEGGSEQEGMSKVQWHMWVQMAHVGACAIMKPFSVLAYFES